MILEKIKILNKKYNQQLKVYADLYKTYLEQEKIQNTDEFEEKHMDEVNNLIASRGELIKKIDAINNDLDLITNCIKDHFNMEVFTLSSLKNHLDTEETRELEKTFTNLQNLLEKIIAVDKKVVEKYKEEKNKQEEKLKEFREGKKGFDAYNPQNKKAPYFLDKKK